MKASKFTDAQKAFEKATEEPAPPSKKKKKPIA